jgi:hypothetical protein
MIPTMTIIELLLPHQGMRNCALKSLITPPWIDCGHRVVGELGKLGAPATVPVQVLALHRHQDGMLSSSQGGPMPMGGKATAARIRDHGCVL